MQDAKSHEGRSPQAVTCGWGVQEQAANAGQRFYRHVCRSEASLCVPLCGCCAASKPYPLLCRRRPTRGLWHGPGCGLEARLRAFVRTRMLSRRGWIEGAICTDVVYRATIFEWHTGKQLAELGVQHKRTDEWTVEGMGEKKAKKRPLQTLPKEVEKALLAGLSASALRMKHAYFLSL